MFGGPFTTSEQTTCLPGQGMLPGEYGTLAVILRGLYHGVKPIASPSLALLKPCAHHIEQREAMQGSFGPTLELSDLNMALRRGMTLASRC